MNYRGTDLGKPPGPKTFPDDGYVGTSTDRREPRWIWGNRQDRKHFPDDSTGTLTVIWDTRVTNLSGNIPGRNLFPDSTGTF
jgi:hypothetical protein